KGMIYDVTVPSHVILVKRDSKAVWSSNLNVLEGWSNITKTVNSSGTIAFKFYASDLAGNWNETEIGIINITQNESSALENIAQVKPEIKIEKIEHPLFVNVLQEFEVKAFITSFNVTTSLQAPQEFIVESLQKNLAQVGENESFIVSWLLKANKCGNYTLNITAEANESKDFKSFDILVKCEQKNTAINAFVSVENVTKEKKIWKNVKIYGNVSLNESITSSNVSIVIKDPKGEIIFQDKASTDGNFLFNFEFLPKHSGTYKAEIFAETEFGNANKILSFEILKHVKIKPKIKQEKFNYGLGEKIKFEIFAIDEDGLLYPNASLKVFLTDPEGNVTEVNFTEDEIEKGKYYVELDTEREFRPGSYRLKVKLSYVSPNPGEVEIEEEIEFSVGLISINTKKSIYHPHERAEIVIVVLNKLGNLISNADISLVITSPDGKETRLSTKNKDIKEIQKGIYRTTYKTKEEGNYTMFATAKAPDVESSITSHFFVRNYYEFDILREVPAVIDPWHGVMQSSIKIISYLNTESFDLKEVLPNSFEIVDSGRAIVIEENNTKVLIWKNLTNASVISYSVRLPLFTPYLYQLGPAEVKYTEEDKERVFVEARPWLLAVDPLNVIGMIAYADTVTAGIPRYRTWDGSTWSSEYSANSVGTAAINWIVLRAFPNAQDKQRFEEFILATKDANNVVSVQVYNGSSWSNPITLVTQTTAYRGFDVAYEKLSGRALIVYADSTPVLKYRIWNGTAWSNELSVGNTKTSNVPNWVKLASRPNSNEIALVYLAPSNLSAIIWNGSAWINEPEEGLERSTNLANDVNEGDSEAFDVAYESLSGDLLVVWGTDAPPYWRYATKPADSSEWSIKDGSALLDEATLVALASEPNTNRIAFASYSESADDIQVAIWDGEAWIDLYPNIDTTAGTWALNDRMIEVAWVGTLGEAVVVYNDGSANIDWINWKYGQGWVIQADYTPSGTTGIDNSNQLYTFPAEDKIFLAYSDANSDLGVATYDGDSWASVNPSPIIEDSLSSIVYEPFMFAFKEFMANILFIYDIIPIYNNQEAQNIESGDLLN
ncbi:MAG: hypothetical protein QW472_05750, partial [Candidatus Aenigmatarchaeota archaeon]